MAARTRQEMERIWLNVDKVKRVSDRVIGLGPFGVGMDGVIAALNATGIGSVVAIPLNQLYTWGAGGWLLHQALQARASPGTIARMLGYIALDSVASGIPVAGAVLDLFFQGHLYAARALQKDIENAHFVEASGRDVHASGDIDRHWAAARAERKRRLVFLHD